MTVKCICNNKFQSIVSANEFRKCLRQSRDDRIIYFFKIVYATHPSLNVVLKPEINILSTSIALNKQAGKINI